MKKRWFLFAGLACVCLLAVASRPHSDVPLELDDGLFSWGGAALAPENRTGLLDALERLDAGVLYQEFPPDSPEAVPFLADMKTAGIQVWLLTGRAEWGLEPDGASLKAEIDRASALSAQSGGGLAGLMVDVEPYLTDQWDADENWVLEQYVSCMTAARQYAQERKLALLACIPYWYDNDHADMLSRLVQTGCDGVAVMNYYRGREAEHIGTEVSLAREAGKPVICIYEFQRPGIHGLTEENTYYTAGLTAARESWAAVRQAADYESTYFAYHWYEPVLELLGHEDKPSFSISRPSN